MPYTTPPTFVSGQILTASQLNVLSADVAYLWGIARGPNIPWPRIGGASGASGTWLIRHRCRYLIAQVQWVHEPGGEPFPLTISYGAETIQTDALGGNGLYTNNYQIDLNPYNFTIGDFYEIAVTSYTGSYFGTYIYFNHLYEAD